MLVNVLNKLFEYSNQFIEVRNERTLPMPGFSIIEKDINGRFIPVILVNLELIPNNESVIAHILSHEWGHHICRHIKLIPPRINEMPNPKEVQQKENEADNYAAAFIAKYNYSKDDIIDFMKKHPHDLENRITILNNAE